MDDFKVIARLMAAVKAGEGQPVFNCSLVAENALKTTAARRDVLARKLQNEGYIDGLYILDGIDNTDQFKILWSNSHPEITMKGLEYLRESQPLRKAMQEIRDTGAEIASQVISNTIWEML